MMWTQLKSKSVVLAVAINGLFCSVLADQCSELTNIAFPNVTIWFATSVERGANFTGETQSE
jgi:hypothetical protein